MNIIVRPADFDAEAILEKIGLRRLQYFEAVAEAGSFSRAAERFDIAQSHLSRQIMRLEAALGHRLFVRRARHVELTDAGQILRQEAKYLSLRLDGLPKRMLEAARGSTGSLSVGFTMESCLNPMVAEVIARLMRQEPQFSLQFCVESGTTLIEAILDCRIQAGFVRPPAVHSREIRVDSLVREPILIAVYRAHRLAGREQVELRELEDEPLILLERNSEPEIYDQTMTACQSAGFSPHVTFHASQPALALALASAGAGCALVPASWRPVHADSLHFASLAGDVLNTSLALITRANEHLASVKVLRKHVHSSPGPRQLRPIDSGHPSPPALQSG